MPKPFDEKERIHLSGGSLDRLVEFLKTECPQDLALCDGYMVAQLVDDIEDIQGGMWSDGIDAMGEDA